MTAPKVPDAVVRACREDYATKQHSTGTLAKKYGVPAPTIIGWITGKFGLSAGGPLTDFRPKNGNKGPDPRVDYDVDANGCWIWRGSIGHDGYPRLKIDGKHWGAHCLAWVLANGPIPGDLTVDHLCFTPACVNPSHLQLLSRVENSRRQRSALSETCKRGHEWTPENTERTGTNRRCRICYRAAQNARNARKRAA